MTDMAGTITVAGGDLFRLAAQQLGDARQWWRIAQANGLRDPVLQGVQVLVIPDPAPAANADIASP